MGCEVVKLFNELLWKVFRWVMRELNFFNELRRMGGREFCLVGGQNKKPAEAGFNIFLVKHMFSLAIIFHNENINNNTDNSTNNNTNA